MMRVSSSAQGPSLGELGQASWPGGTAPFGRGHAPRRMGLAPLDREASFWGGWSAYVQKAMHPSILAAFKNVALQRHFDILQPHIDI